MISVIFSHEAIGKNNKHITVYKFRTMSGEISPNRDPKLSLSGELDITDKNRLTLIGKIIRPIGFDEIPQIYNLLISRDMQLIGIRPFLIDEYNLLPLEIRELLSKQKPGIIPAEAYYDYEIGNLESRISAINAYLKENPSGFRKIEIAFIALINRIFKYSKR